MKTKQNLIQRLNQLKDRLTGKKLNKLNKDILKLKLTDDDKFILTMKNKYYEI